MIVAPRVPNCVVFVGAQPEDGDPVYAGTAFLLMRKSAVLPNLGISYVVTAAHVIRGLQRAGVETILIFLNRKGGERQPVRTRATDWHFHPTDWTVDVAVHMMPVQALEGHDYWPLDAAATPQFFADHGLGVGEDIVMAGLFSEVPGETRFRPIVRVGNLASWADELVPAELIDAQGNTSRAAIRAYLVETRSMGGLSGSPVFIHPGSGMRLGAPVIDSGHCALLGLMQGHYQPEPKQASSIADTAVTRVLNARDAEIRAFNMGIGLVVPVELISEVVHQPRLLEMATAAERSWVEMTSART